MLNAMTAPMSAAQIQSFAPMIHAHGIAGVPTAQSLRHPAWLQAPAPSHLRNGRDMTTHALAGEVPNMEKRMTMNFLLLGSALGPVGMLGIPYALFFVPPSAGGGGGGTVATDILGNAGYSVRPLLRSTQRWWGWRRHSGDRYPWECWVFRTPSSSFHPALVGVEAA